LTCNNVYIFLPKQNAETSVKRFSYFIESQVVPLFIAWRANWAPSGFCF